eukprot:403376692
MKIGEAFRPPSAVRTTKSTLSFDNNNKRKDKEFMANCRDSQGIKSTLDNSQSAFQDNKSHSSAFMFTQNKEPINPKTQPTVSGQKNPEFKHPNFQSSEVFYNQSASDSSNHISTMRRQKSVNADHFQTTNATNQSLMKFNATKSRQNKTIQQSKSVSNFTVRRATQSNFKQNNNNNTNDNIFGSDKNNDLDTSTLSKSGNKKNQSSLNLSHTKKKSMRNTSLGVSGLLNGKINKEDVGAQNSTRKTVQNTNHQSQIDSVFQHYDGSDPKSLQYSVNQSQLDQDSIKKSKSLKKFSKFVSQQNKSSIFDDLNKSTSDTNNRQRSNSRDAAANKRNTSTFNVINGVEKSPLKQPLSKKMYNIESSNPISQEQTNGKFDDSGAQQKNYGNLSFSNQQAVQIENTNYKKSQIFSSDVSTPQMKNQKDTNETKIQGAQTMNFKQNKSQVYFQQSNTPKKQRPQFQDSDTEDRPRQMQKIEPLHQSSPNQSSKPQESFSRDYQKEVFTQKQKALEQQQLRVAQTIFKSSSQTVDLSNVSEPKSFAEMVGNDSQKSVFEQKQKQRLEAQQKCQQNMMNPKQGSREQEKSKLTNDNRANDTFVDGLSGDSLKKLHKEREQSRSKSRQKIQSFPPDQYQDSKSVMQRDFSQPLIEDDHSKMSDKQRELKRMSKELKEQIAKRLEYLQQEKQRMIKEDSVRVENAQKQDQEDKEQQFNKRLELTQQSQAQAIALQKQQEKKKVEDKIQKQKELDQNRQIQSQQVSGGIHCIAKVKRISIKRRLAKQQSLQKKDQSSQKNTIDLSGVKQYEQVNRNKIGSQALVRDYKQNGIGGIQASVSRDDFSERSNDLKFKNKFTE